MLLHIEKHLPIVLTAVITATIFAAGPTVAQAAYDAMNADKVDGKHAVGSGATPASRAGKLVATNSLGQLPDNIIKKAPDADSLDGLNSDAFARGPHTTILHNRFVVPSGPPSAPTQADLLTIPGFGSFRVFCRDDYGAVYFDNDTSGSVDLWLVNASFSYGTVQPPASQVVVAETQVGNLIALVDLGVGNTTSASRTATVNVATYQSSPGAPCGFQIEATVWRP